MNKLDDFIERNSVLEPAEASYISAEQIRGLNIGIEDFLEYLSSGYSALLYGSREDIIGNVIKSNALNRLFCSDMAGIAMMKAIISNKKLSGLGLTYPYFIDEKNHLEIRIEGMNEKTIGEKGFVYVIPDRESFYNHPSGSWQYITRASEVYFSAKIEVRKEDFNYPVFDAEKNLRII